MKEKFRKILKDPLFYKACAMLAAMGGAAVIQATIHGRLRYPYFEQGIYVLYFILLIFFVRFTVKLYLKYFREKKEKKKNRLIEKIRLFFKAADEKLRVLFNMKPRGAFFGGEDTEYKAEAEAGEKRAGQDGEARIRWSRLRKNQDRIRFLYAARIDRGIEEGADITPSDTARQAERKLSCDERDRLLFELYENVRYSDKIKPIDDGTVTYLSEKNVKAISRKKKNR